MQYLRTRSHDEKATSAEAVLRGLAPDGGLYVPEAIPAAGLSEDALLSLDQFCRICPLRLWKPRCGMDIPESLKQKT